MNSTVETKNGPSMLYRLGVVGFWFFLIKGMLWVIAPFVFFYFV